MKKTLFIFLGLTLLGCQDLNKKKPELASCDSEEALSFIKSIHNVNGWKKQVRIAQFLDTNYVFGKITELGFNTEKEFRKCQIEIQKIFKPFQDKIDALVTISNDKTAPVSTQTQALRDHIAIEGFLSYLEKSASEENTYSMSINPVYLIKYAENRSRSKSAYRIEIVK